VYLSAQVAFLFFSCCFSGGSGLTGKPVKDVVAVAAGRLTCSSAADS